jgi:hypothetical protein
VAIFPVASDRLHGNDIGKELLRIALVWEPLLQNELLGRRASVQSVGNILDTSYEEGVAAAGS